MYVMGIASVEVLRPKAGGRLVVGVLLDEQFPGNLSEVTLINARSLKTYSIDRPLTDTAIEARLPDGVDVQELLTMGVGRFQKWLMDVDGPPVTDTNTRFIPPGRNKFNNSTPFFPIEPDAEVDKITSSTSTASTSTARATTGRRRAQRKRRRSSTPTRRSSTPTRRSPTPTQSATNPTPSPDIFDSWPEPMGRFDEPTNQNAITDVVRPNPQRAPQPDSQQPAQAVQQALQAAHTQSMQMMQDTHQQNIEAMRQQQSVNTVTMLMMASMPNQSPAAANLQQQLAQTLSRIVAPNQPTPQQQQPQQPAYTQPPQQPAYNQAYQQSPYDQTYQQPIYNQPPQQPTYNPSYNQQLQQLTYHQPPQQPTYSQPHQQPHYNQPPQQQAQQQPHQPTYNQPHQQP